MTFWMMAAVVLLPIAVGLPIVRGLAGNRPLQEDDWCEAPFVGAALLILPLQAAYYFGIPVGVSARPWVAALLLCGALVIALRRGRGGWGRPPIAIGLVALGLYAFHGAGLIWFGALRYLARGWTDQYNYVGVAEFLMHHGYGDMIASARPFAEWVGATLSAHRIGQSTLHVVFASLIPVGTKAWFEPVIIWSAFLLPLALYTMGRRLGLSRVAALSAAAAGGVLPAVATIHLEAFFSHALASPFLLMLLPLCARVRAEGRIGDAIKCALVVGVATALYFEFLQLILVPVVCLIASTLLTSSGRTPRRLAGMLLPLAAPFALNHARIVIGIAFNVSAPVLGAIYPWAYSVEGIQRLWIGDLVLRPDVLTALVPRLAAVLLAAAGFVGWGVHLWSQVSRWNGADDRRVADAMLACLGAAFVTLPVLLMVRDADHSYQVYKVWLTVSPLLVCGITLLLAAYAEWSRARGPLARLAYRAGIATGCAAAGLAAFGTATMIAATVDPDPTHASRRQSGFVVTEEFAEAERVLTGLRNRDIVLCANDSGYRGNLNAWLAYFGRGTRVWPLNYQLTDRDLRRLQPAGTPHYLSGFPALTPDVLLVTSPYGALYAEGVKTTLMSRGEVLAYRGPSAGPLVVACHSDLRPSGDGRTAAIAIHAAAREMTVASNVRTDATLFLRAADPASVAFLATLRLFVDNVEAPFQQTGEHGSLFSFTLRPGVNLLDFRASRTEPEPAWPIVVQATQMSLMLGTEWVALERVDNPNGTDRMDGEVGYWLGGGTTTGMFVAGRAGTMRLRFLGTPGPSRRDTTRRVRVSTDAGFEHTLAVTGGEIVLDVPIVRGRQAIRLQPLDVPDTVVPTDARPMLVAVQRLQADLLPETVARK